MSNFSRGRRRQRINGNEPDFFKAEKYGRRGDEGETPPTGEMRGQEIWPNTKGGTVRGKVRPKGGRGASEAKKGVTCTLKVGAAD